MDSFAEFLKFLLPIAVPALVTYAYDPLQDAIAWLKKLPAWLTPILVAAVTFWMMKLGMLIGAQLPGTDPTMWTQGEWTEFASALLAYLFKIGKNQKAFAERLNP